MIPQNLNPNFAYFVLPLTYSQYIAPVHALSSIRLTTTHQEIDPPVEIK